MKLDSLLQEAPFNNENLKKNQINNIMDSLNAEQMDNNQKSF
jgi:hypothetical protein